MGAAHAHPAATGATQLQSAEEEPHDAVPLEPASNLFRRDTHCHDLTQRRTIKSGDRLVFDI